MRAGIVNLWVRLVFRLKVLLLDFIASLWGLCFYFGLRLSLFFTVLWRWGPASPLVVLSVPVRPRVRLRDVGDARPRGTPLAVSEFSVVAGSRFDSRLVAWFYRWHDTPTLDDWRACLALAGCSVVPLHALALPRGGRVFVDVCLTGAGSLQLRFDARDRFFGAGTTVYCGPVPLGGLASAEIIRTILTHLSQ